MTHGRNTVNFNRRLGVEFLLDESKTEFSKHFVSSTMNCLQKKKDKENDCKKAFC